jgi:hypothetical protein
MGLHYTVRASNGGSVLFLAFEQGVDEIVDHDDRSRMGEEIQLTRQ